MESIAKVKNLDFKSDNDKREIIVTIEAKGSMYIQEPTGYGFPYVVNSGPLIEGFDKILAGGHHAVKVLTGNKDYTSLIEENKKLKQHIRNSDLAARVKQFLSALDYGSLTDFQAKCVLLLERELNN